MKRLWIGIGLLAAVLVLGAWSAAGMSRVHTAVADNLVQAAQAARSGQWEAADRYAADAAEKWEDGWHFSAALADHTVLDEIDGLFAQSEEYRKSRSAVEYAAICARLARHIEALQESHRLNWWNLL